MNIGPDWRAWLEFTFWREGYDVYLFQAFGENRLRILQPDGSTIEQDKHAVVDRQNVKPFIHLDRDQLQALVDALGDKGIVAHGRRHEEETALLKDHLRDMRTLVFKGKAP